MQILRRWIPPIVAGSIVVLAVHVGATAAADESRLAPAARWAAWNQRCMFSHRNNDDPIRFPGRPGRSHDHTYFGNRSTNASSTPASLLRNPRTTCGERADRSAYWVPTLFVGGWAVQPLGVVTQYLTRTYGQVEPLPAGLKMIAGNQHARTVQSSRVTSWSCAVEGSRRSSTMPTCPRVRSGGGLILRVAFPDCWDGEHLDSPNHRSHMAYSSNGTCPGPHPFAVPALSLFILYPVSGGPTTELASGGQLSGRADFVNAWKQVRLAALLKRYLNVIGPRLAPPDPIGLGPCEGCPGQ